MAHITPAQLQEFKQRYARWWYDTHKADEAWEDYTHSLGDLDWSARGDMDDFIDSIKTLRTFGPNPRAFDPPILPEDFPPASTHHWVNQHAPDCPVTHERSKLLHALALSSTHTPEYWGFVGALPEYDLGGDQELENCTCSLTQDPDPS